MGDFGGSTGGVWWASRFRSPMWRIWNRNDRLQFRIINDLCFSGKSWKMLWVISGKSWIMLWSREYQGIHFFAAFIFL
jgi:hypothetical protein